MARVELVRDEILKLRETKSVRDVASKVGCSWATIMRFLETGEDRAIIHSRRSRSNGKANGTNGKNGAHAAPRSNADGRDAAVLEFSMRGVIKGWWGKDTAMAIVGLLSDG